MTQNANRLWVAAFVLGWGVDFLFWGQSLGVNFVIFTVLTVLSGFCLLISSGKRPANQSLWLILPFLFFSFMTVFRREPLTRSLAYTFSLFSMGVIVVTYLGGRWVQFSLLDYFNQFFHLVGSLFELPVSFFFQVRKERTERGETGIKLPFVPILRGLVIALPIVAFFAALLSAADMIFKQKLADFLGIFSVGKIAEDIIRILIILFSTYILTGSFLHAASESRNEKLLGEEQPVIKPFLGFTETTIVLGSVVGLFLVFVIIQFHYFFGGNINIGIEGFTYSQYARRGFNELVIVAFSSLLMILGFSTITKREKGFQKNIYSGLSIAIVALVMVILISAYQRLALAIDWHGFSRLRIYPRIFLIWVGLLFVAVVVLEVLRRERYFAFAAVLASIGFAASLCLFNVDASIVQRNVFRASIGKHFNASYLGTLSLDAVPTLADEFQDSSLPVGTREGIGAALLCYLHSEDMKNIPNDWRSLDFSQWQAQKALDNVKPQLAGYRVNKNRTPIRVRTPGNVLYECLDEESGASED